MDGEIDIRKLAALVRSKRAAGGLRTVAKEIGGISASTLSRVEQGRVPDLDTFARLCRWLDVAPEQFMPGLATATGGLGSLSAPEGMGTPEIIAAHLRADRTLAPETADALATMIRLAYQAVTRSELSGGVKERKGASRVQDVG